MGVKEKYGGSTKKWSIEKHVDANIIENTLNDAKKFEETDKKKWEILYRKNLLESFLYETKMHLGTHIEIIENKCNEIIEWLDKNNLQNLECLIKKQKELQTFLESYYLNQKKVVKIQR